MNSAPARPISPFLTPPATVLVAVPETDDAPRAGEVIAIRIRLPHGATDRFVEVTESGYVDVNGEPVTGDVVSYRYPSADELADWLDHKRETELHECLPASYPVPGDGACYEHFLRPVKTARCAGCQKRRKAIAMVGCEAFCLKCSAALVMFVMKGAA